MREIRTSGSEGGAAQSNASSLPLSLMAGISTGVLSTKLATKKQSSSKANGARRLPATHISAATGEAKLGWDFVASFVAASRSRFVTIRPVVSSLFGPASTSAAGGPADLKLSLWCGIAGDGIDVK